MNNAQRKICFERHLNGEIFSEVLITMNVIYNRQRVWREHSDHLLIITFQNLVDGEQHTHTDKLAGEKALAVVKGH